MTSALLYCPTCGAANAPEDSLCFACQEDLTLHSTKNPPTALLQKRYELLAQVGVGGFGAVYRARDIQDQSRLVAIKQINLRGLTPQEVIDATDGFNREVGILSGLVHAHLPRIHAHFTDPEHWYVVMDFIEGQTLEDYLHDLVSSQANAIRALALDEVLDIGLQLCDVLAYLHTRQPPIIFRDLKPSNLMRTSRGKLYVIDFGIARYFKPGQARDTSPLGSPGYAAPEQYGRAQTDGRADIYSLGALLYHLLSRADPSEIPFAFPPLRVSGPDGLSELAALVTSMVEVDVEARPATIGEVRDTLQHIRALRDAQPRIWQPAPGQTPPAAGSYAPIQVQQQIMHSGAQPPSAQVAASKKGSRRKFLVGGLAVASALSLGGFSYWKYWHPARLALAAGFPWRLQSPTSAVSTLALSPGGQCVAFGLSDGSIVCNQISNKVNNNFVLPFTFRFNANNPALPITALAWSPSNIQLVAVSRRGQFQLWDVTVQRGYSITTGTGDIKAVAWSPDGQLIAVVDDLGVLGIYNAQTGVLGSPEGLTGANVLAWSPDGTHLATQLPSSSTQPDTLQLWGVNASQSSGAIQIGTTSVTALAWSPDGTSLAALSVNGTLQVWDNLNQTYNSDTNNVVFSQQISTQQTQLAWSPDGHFLAVIDDTNNLLILDRSNGNTLISTPITDRLGLGGIFPGQALTWPDSEHILVVNSNMECWQWSLAWL